MTDAAFNLCRYVINLLERCNTRVVAGRTITAHNNVLTMHKSASEAIKGACSVARRTVQVRHYMTNRLTNTDIAIMAGQAVAGICAGVVKRHSSKVSGVMANGAVLVVGTGRYVIRQFTDTNRVVMARVTATSNTGMVIGTSGKGARSVTNTTILIGRHVVERFTAGINTMTGRAIVHDIGMIDECTSETISVMARSTIGTGCRVGRHRRGFSGRVNTIAIIVT